MKLLAIIAAVCMATASAQVPDCDLATLMAVARGPSGATCQADTQFTPSPGTIATGEKLLKFCKNSNCQKLLSELNAATPTECLYSGIPIKSGIIEKYNAACKAALAETTPTATTAAPSSTSNSSGNQTQSNSTNGDATVTTTGPSATTPKPSSGGTVVVAATACAVLASALALLA